MGRRGIYVETTIRTGMTALWDATQTPEQHARWDLRFTRISPAAIDDSGVTAFAYERRTLVHTVRGMGVSIGEKHAADGSRTSALRFSTHDRLSPIAAGRGYWRYVPREDGIVFITGYDYTPGWGILDVAVRPLLGWATAWSFDRLRIWLETGVPPEHWSLWSVLQWWRPGRPRAARCRRVAVGGTRRGDQLTDAPATLAALPEPASNA